MNEDEIEQSEEIRRHEVGEGVNARRPRKTRPDDGGHGHTDGEKVEGATACKPGKPCGPLTMVLNETEEAAKPGIAQAGLFRYAQISGQAGVLYRNRKGTRAMPATNYVLAFCPFCGKDPTRYSKPTEDNPLGMQQPPRKRPR